MNNNTKDTNKENVKAGQTSNDKQNLIDTDNDGKLRQKGDTTDHGDPKSPFGKTNKNQEQDKDDSGKDSE